MPLLRTAQRGSHLRPARDDYYVFPEQHKGNWARFYESMGGDQEKILSWADKAGIEHPKAWFESLHRFLFDLYSGTAAMLKKAAKDNFSAFLKDIHTNHTKNPKPVSWYRAQGITPNRFLEVMKEASEIKQIDQAIAYVNARVMNLGYYLYAEYILSKTDEAKSIKSVAAQRNKEAYDLECLALGRSPLSALKEGDNVIHSFANFIELAVEKIIWEDPDHSSIATIVARDKNKTPYILSDIWNLRKSA